MGADLSWLQYTTMHSSLATALLRLYPTGLGAKHYYPVKQL